MTAWWSVERSSCAGKHYSHGVFRSSVSNILVCIVSKECLEVVYDIIEIAQLSQYEYHRMTIHTLEADESASTLWREVVCTRKCTLCDVVVLLQDGGCGGSKVRAQEVDPLLRERHFHHLPRGAQRVRPGAGRVRWRGQPLSFIPPIHLNMRV